MRRRSPSPPNHSDHIHTKPRDDQWSRYLSGFVGFVFALYYGYLV